MQCRFYPVCQVSFPDFKEYTSPLEIFLKGNFVVATNSHPEFTSCCWWSHSWERWGLEFCAKAFVKGLFLNGSSGLEALVCNNFFFNRNFKKQQYHVISHMLPEPEILALLQADLLVKQIWFVIQFSSDSLRSLTTVTEKQIVLIYCYSKSYKTLIWRRQIPAVWYSLSLEVCACSSGASCIL